MADGIVNGSANLGWKYKNVKAELEELTGIKVKVGNDANVAALGEMWKGGGQGNKDLIMVTLGTLSLIHIYFHSAFSPLSHSYIIMLLKSCI